MPKMKVCPNRKQHPPSSYKEHTIVIGDTTHTSQVPVYKRFKTPMGKRHVDYNPEDRMFRVYYRTTDSEGRTLWIRTGYWYCPKCNLICHEDYIDNRYGTDSKYLIVNNAF